MNIIEKLGVTKGKWYVVGNMIYRRPKSELYEYGGAVAGDKPIVSVCKGWHSHGLRGYPVENNARLIAAAPEMLEALIDVYYTQLQYGGYENIIEPILEKATGKTWKEIKELL